MDTWAYPGLLVGKSIVTPAPVSADTAWELSPRSGRTVPVFRLTWGAAGTAGTEAVRVTQRLSSQVLAPIYGHLLP